MFILTALCYKVNYMCFSCYKCSLGIHIDGFFGIIHSRQVTSPLVFPCLTGKKWRDSQRSWLLSGRAQNTVPSVQVLSALRMIPGP